MPCYYSKRYKQNNIETRQSNEIQIDKPVVLPFNKNLLKNFSIVIFVGSSYNCNDPNRFVDYVIKWLLEDGLSVEKVSALSPQGKKFNVMSTPHVIIFEKQIPKTRIDWKGVGIAYKAIINYLVSKIN